MELNKIYNLDCLRGMGKIASESVDLTVTSPPYDDLRTYNGFSWDFEKSAEEIYRITKPGGMVVWIVGDGTNKGSETGTSFYQALYFKKIGFNLHDTMIWKKWSPFPDKTRYNQSFEYMFIFSKGKPKTWNEIERMGYPAGYVEHGKDGASRSVSRKPCKRSYNILVIRRGFDI